MGRRKIEIQPITHERNRSVTFLKRKNGLFKKAYELGVLCSVDVAVIIFEERPGHHLKLYQYCSGDVNNMVQRHLRFDGERDTKGPHDFSGAKAEDAGDDDEDGDEDDGRPKMNGKSAKPKIESSGNGIHRPSLHTDLTGGMDIDYRSSNARGSPNSLHSPSLPISGERLNMGASNMRSIPISNNKRPRLAPLAGDISPNSHLHAAQSAPAAINGPSSAGGSGPTYPYRLEVDLSFPSSGHISSIASSIPPHGATHPSLSSMYPHSNGLMSSQGSPPFMNSFDFSRPQQGAPTLRSVTFPSHGGSQYSGQSQQQQSGVYQSQGQRPSTQPHVQTNNLFADLLETAANEHHSAHQSSQNSFPSFDWPVHNQQSQSQRETTSVTQPPSQNPTVSEANWLDFLSASSQSGPTNNSSQPHSQHSPALPLPHQNHGPGRPASNSVSSTRSNGSYAMTPASSMDSLSPSTLGRKRSRDDDAGAMSVSDLGTEDEEMRANGNGKLEHGSEGSPAGSTGRG